MSKRIRMAGLLSGVCLVFIAGACSTARHEPEPPEQVAENPAEFEPFDEPPMIKHYVEPDYPEYAKQNHLTGHVMLRVTVSDKGKVERVFVLESTDAMFEAPAIAAAKQFRFEPARFEGRAVRASVMVPVDFQL